MEKFLQDLSNPYWWLSIVIVGLLINLFSSVIFKRLEGFSAKRSEKKRQELESERQARQAKVDQLKGKKEDQILYHFNINHLKQSSIENFLLGIIMVNIPFLVPILNSIDLLGMNYKVIMVAQLIINTVFGLFAYYFIWKGMRLRRQAKLELDIVMEAMTT